MSPLATSHSDDPRIQELLDALREHGWQLAHILDDTAVLNHPDRPSASIALTVDVERTDRIAKVDINGQTMPMAWATNLIRKS
jgi:hypothetical protein